MIRSAWLTLVMLLVSSPALAGTGYRVTSMQGDQEVTYMVNFGGGRQFKQHTAYDPASKKFVYLKWGRGEAAPTSVGSIWDHETGRTIKLYKFPKAEHPLPVIPSIEAMKVCPKTGDRNFKSKRFLAYD